MEASKLNTLEFSEIEIGRANYIEFLGESVTLESIQK